MNKTEQETPFSGETIKFRPHIVYKFFGPFNRLRRLLKGCHLFSFHPVELFSQELCIVGAGIFQVIFESIDCDLTQGKIGLSRAP